MKDNSLAISYSELHLTFVLFEKLLGNHEEFGKFEDFLDYYKHKCRNDIPLGKIKTFKDCNKNKITLEGKLLESNPQVRIFQAKSLCDSIPKSIIDFFNEQSRNLKIGFLHPENDSIQPNKCVVEKMYMTSSLLQCSKIFLEKGDINSALTNYMVTGKYLNFQRSLKTGLLLFDNLILEQLIGFIISDTSNSNKGYFEKFKEKYNSPNSAAISNIVSEIMYSLKSDSSDWNYTYDCINDLLRNEIEPILAVELFRRVSKIRKNMYSNSAFERIEKEIYS
jgi:hypothetical protein